MPQSPHKLGVDANRPVTGDGAATATVNPDLFADVHAGWVRVNFILGPWSSTDDTTLHSGQSWAQAFDAIVDDLRTQGLAVYGLIGRESVKTDLDGRLDTLFRFPAERMSQADRDAAQAWIAQYAAAFARIAHHFAGRVTNFESFNEPDDWHGMAPTPDLPSPNWIHPQWFARMLQAVHDAVRAEPGLGAVTLVSGPLQGLQVGNGAASYLGRTYQAGQRTLGWGRDGRGFPFDGVGYHLYIEQEFDPNAAAHALAVRRRYRQYVDELLRVIRNAEGATSRKPLFVSEIGWESNDDTPADLQFQADNVRLGLELVAADPAVALGVWFCTEDFEIGQGQRQFYGLHHAGQVNPAGRKPSFAAYRSTVDRLFGAVPVASVFTNQNVINALFRVAAKVGKDGWALVVAAGLADLVKARQAPYSGPAIDDLPNLTGPERALLREALPGLQPVTRAVALPTPSSRDALALGAARSVESAAAAGGLTGKGMWIVRIEQLLKTISARPGPADLNERLAAMAAGGGLTHVLVKVADGGSAYNVAADGTDRVRPLVQALRAAGIAVWGWQFIYGFRASADPAQVIDVPPELQAELAIRRVEQYGLDGFVVNAEGTLKGQPGRAQVYMERLRADLPDLPVGLSSYRFPRLHQDFPWAEFLAHCDLNMPQVYWFNTPPAEALRRSLTESAGLPHARPVFPTGAAYLMEGGISATPEAIRAFLSAAHDDFGLAGANFFQWNSAMDAGRWDAVAAFDWRRAPGPG